MHLKSRHPNDLGQLPSHSGAARNKPSTSQVEEDLLVPPEPQHFAKTLHPKPYSNRECRHRWPSPLQNRKPLNLPHTLQPRTLNPQASGHKPRTPQVCSRPFCHRSHGCVCSWEQDSVEVSHCWLSDGLGLGALGLKVFRVVLRNGLS